MTGAAARVRCPAKINLRLQVLGLREDGYHELDTVFQAIDLWDTLSIGRAKALTLSCDAPGLPTGETNLALRAARLLAESHPGPERGGRLVLGKRIPVEAGLGGGSSDAAAALVLCNHFWGLDLPVDRLAELASRIGADVPFFLTGGTARGTGRGDRIEPLPFAGATWLVCGCPPFGIRTRDVFERLGARLTLPRIGVNFPRLSAHKWPKENDFGFSANDLEAVVFEDWPGLGAFRDALLEAGAREASLSGSGSTVYGTFTEPDGAVGAAKRVRETFDDWRVITTRFIPDGIRWGAKDVT